MNNKQTLYDPYCRKSQEDEDKQVLSLEAQEKECKEFAAKNGVKIRKIWHESYSAKAPGRKLFNEMMQDPNVQKKKDEHTVLDPLIISMPLA